MSDEIYILKGRRMQLGQAADLWRHDESSALVWIPHSQMRGPSKLDGKLDGEVPITAWIAKQKGLI